MYKIIPILVLVAVAHGQGSGDLDSVLSQIFGPAPGSGTTAQPVQDKTHGSTIVPPIHTNSNTAVARRLSHARVGRRRNQGARRQHCPDSTNYRSVHSESAIEEDLSCKMPDGQEGECVSYYLCNVANNTVITDGIGVIDIRVRDGPCESYIDTCCLVPDKRPPDQPIKPIPKPDEPQVYNNETEVWEPAAREGCGWANPDGADLRTTGEVNGETKFGEFPWMVAILNIPADGSEISSLIEPVNENEPDGMKLNVYVGGGSLIHPSVVLTAAHYVANANALRIRAGEWDTQSTKEIYPFQDRDVAEVVTHKDFNKGNLFYDIAILFLAAPVDLTLHVGIACLPQPKIKPDDGTRCFATGWGKDVFGKEGRYQVILKKIELPIVKHDKCQSSLRKTRLGRFFQLHSTFMCAGGEPGKDTCKGDGGSPLSCPIEYEKDRYVQSGIVAWGIGCGEDGTPGVYVDVSVLRDWIDDKVAGKGYDPKTYTY